MKKFWKRTEGFTLVELVVVIAILGVLAGVGTVSYSGYVKKANMAADQQLASKVAHALSLYYYSHPNEATSGYVILTQEGEICGYDTNVGLPAMDAVFGDGWEETVSLKYNSWAPRYLNGVGDKAEAILDSSYVTGIGTTQLLSDVKQCASALGEFLGSMGGDAADKLAGKLDSADNTPFKDMMQAAGYYDEKNGTYNNVSQAALGNAAVFSVADYVKNNNASIYNGISDISDGYLNDGPLTLYQNSTSPIYAVACWYAAMEGLASYMGGDVEKVWRAQQGDNLAAENVTGKNALAIVTQMEETHRALKAECEKDPTKMMQYYGLEFDEEIGGFAPSASAGVTQAQKDADAFLAMMGTVNDMSGDFTNKEDLDNTDLIISNEVSDALDAYVNTAKNSESLNAAISGIDGPCMIIHLIENGKTVIDPANVG